MAPGPSGGAAKIHRSTNRSYRHAAQAVRRRQGARARGPLRASGARHAKRGQRARLMHDGSPQVAPVWVDLDGDLVLVGTGEGSLKAKNTRRDARVGLSIIAMDNPYREAQIRGRV